MSWANLSCCFASAWNPRRLCKPVRSSLNANCSSFDCNRCRLRAWRITFVIVSVAASDELFMLPSSVFTCGSISIGTPGALSRTRIAMFTKNAGGNAESNMTTSSLSFLRLWSALSNLSISDRKSSTSSSWHSTDSSSTISSENQELARLSEIAIAFTGALLISFHLSFPESWYTLNRTCHGRRSTLGCRRPSCFTPVSLHASGCHAIEPRRVCTAWNGKPCSAGSGLHFDSVGQEPVQRFLADQVAFARS